MTEPFHSARAKIARAKKLTRELETTIRDFDGAFLAPEPEGSVLNFVVRIHAPLPDVAENLGDVIHNLRAALDHTAVSVVALNEKNPKGVYFPFAHSADDLPEQIERKKFNRASPEAQALLTSMRPYVGGDETLRALHDLDLLDKHNDLIPTYSAAAQKVPLHLPDLCQISGGEFPLKEGMTPFTIGGLAGLNVPPMPLGLVARFPIGGPFADEEVVPILTSLSHQVVGIVDAFEALSLR